MESVCVLYGVDIMGGGALKYNAGLPGALSKGGGDFKKNIKT